MAKMVSKELLRDLDRLAEMRDELFASEDACDEADAIAEEMAEQFGWVRE